MLKKKRIKLAESAGKTIYKTKTYNGDYLIISYTDDTFTLMMNDGDDNWNFDDGYPHNIFNERFSSINVFIYQDKLKFSKLAENLIELDIIDSNKLLEDYNYNLKQKELNTTKRLEDRLAYLNKEIELITEELNKQQKND